MPTKRSVEVHKENPFLEGKDALRISTVKRRGPLASNRAVVNTETGEVENVAEIVKVYEVDDDKFVKLFSQNLRVFFSLKPSTFKMLEVLLYEMQKTPGNDRVYLNVEAAREYFESHGVEPIAKATFHKSITELVEKSFIALSTRQNLYFINPAIFFNGDRARFVTEYRRKKTSKKTIGPSQEWAQIEEQE